jgi:hypothetical protein
MMWKSKNSIRLKSEIGLQFWKTSVVVVVVRRRRGTSRGLGKLLKKYESFSHKEYRLL